MAILNIKKNLKLNLCYTRLILFRVSRISRGAHLRGFAPGPTLQGAAVASRLQRVGDLNPILPAPEADALFPLVRDKRILVTGKDTGVDFTPRL